MELLFGKSFIRDKKKNDGVSIRIPSRFDFPSQIDT